MPTRRVVGVEWRDWSDATRYPFADTAPLTNSKGDFIPDNVFLDAVIHPVGGKERAYISEVRIAGDSVTLSIGDVEERQRCQGSFSLASPPNNIRLLDRYGRSAGLLVSEASRLTVFATMRNLVEFEIGETEFAATCCIPVPDNGVRGIVLDDGTVMDGDVWLVGSGGVILKCERETVHTGTGETRDEAVIVVNVVGDPLPGIALDPLAPSPRFLERLTVMSSKWTVIGEPSSVLNVRNFELLPGSVIWPHSALRIRPTERGIRIEIAAKEG